MESVQTKKTWRRGPVPKPKSELRKNRVNVFFTDAEIADLEKFSSGMSLSNFIRFAATSRDLLPRPMPEINSQAWEEIGRIGNNLNQIARHLNAGENVEIEKIRNELNALRLKIIDVV